jgi:hypothetical protein
MVIKNRSLGKNRRFSKNLDPYCTGHGTSTGTPKKKTDTYA